MSEGLYGYCRCGRSCFEPGGLCYACKDEERKATMTMSETSQHNMLQQSLEWHQWAEEIAEMMGMPLSDTPVTSPAELRDSITAYLSAAHDAGVSTRAQVQAKEAKARHAGAHEAVEKLKDEPLVRELLRRTGQARLVDLRSIQNELRGLIEELAAANPLHSATSERIGESIAQQLRVHGPEVSAFITLHYGVAALQVLIACYEETT